MRMGEIGRFIAELRKEKGITQQQLADAIYVSRETVSKWERGVNCIDVDTLVVISKYMNISIDELIAAKKKDPENEEEISKTVVGIFKNQNQKITKLRRFLIILIFASVFAIFGVYFINNYNSIQVYTMSAEGEHFDLYQGMLFISKEKSFIKFGNINNKENAKITNVSVYYKNKDKEQILINRNYMDTLVIDLNDYEDFVKNRENFIDNLYFKINTKDFSDELKIDKRLSFSNRYFITRKYKNIKKEYEENTPVKTFEAKFTVKTKIDTYNCTFDNNQNLLNIESKNNKDILITYYNKQKYVEIIKDDELFIYYYDNSKCSTNNCENYMNIINDIKENIILG